MVFLNFPLSSLYFSHCFDHNLTSIRESFDYKPELKDQIYQEWDSLQEQYLQVYLW